MKKKEISLQAETEAMQKIAVEVEKLPQESRERIANWLLSIVGIPSSTPAPRPKSPMPRDVVHEQAHSEVQSYTSSETIKEFFHGKKPRNNYQKLATIGYYLEFMKGKDEFNNNDLKHAWKLTREALPSSKVFSNSLNNTISTYNYFVAGSKKGLYRIGIKGQNLVEELPNQSKTLASAAKKRTKKRK